MRVISFMILVGLMAVSAMSLAQAKDTASQPATTTADTPASPPLERLPLWAVPESYQLALRSDPEQSGYTGTVSIALNLKKPSSYFWLHGKDLDVSDVVITDAAGHQYAGHYTEAAPKVGVARIDFGRTLQPQKLDVTIRFSAPYNGTLEGYYKVDFAGDAYVMTQMEPISARLAFPCFDEPAFKAPLTLSLTVPENDKAVANAPEQKTIPAGDGWKTVKFETTKPLPTYLYAWAVGPWDIVQGPTIPATEWRSNPVPVRGIATRGNGPKMKRALAMVPGIIEFEENYYGFGYPFGKLDLAALPDFSAGAMENPGLVTFRDWLMLLDKDSTPSAIRRSFNVSAHELAHQWTGDTVTLEWWNDIWLNEAFATWMQQKVEQAIHPRWRGDLARLRGGLGAMRNDSLTSARMIREPITGNGDIHTAFDGITYQKGAAVIGMFENFVGKDVFRSGMRNYIEAHNYGNADADDLVDAIAQAAGKGKTFETAFKSFLNQNGVPEVSTHLDCSDKDDPQLNIAQSRYLPLGSTGDPDRKWGIPVCVRFPNGVQCQLLNKPTASIDVKGGQCPVWYMPNANGQGYYRFSMARGDREALNQVITERNDLEQLAYADSISAAFHNGDLDAGDVLAAMRKLAPSKVRPIALSMLGTVGWIYQYEARTDAEKDAVREAVVQAYLPRLEALGYRQREGEPADAALMRSSLAATLGLAFEVPQVRAALLNQGEAALETGPDGLPRLDAANPDLLGTALAVAVEEIGKPAIKTLLTAIPKTTDPVKRNAMLGALGHAQGVMANTAREFALSPAVKVGEMNMVLRGGRETRAQRDAWWNWFTDHYQRIAARTGVFSASALPSLAAGGACSEAEAKRLETFFQPHLDEVPGMDRGLAQTRESVLLCSALKAAQDPAVIMR